MQLLAKSPGLARKTISKSPRKHKLSTWQENENANPNLETQHHGDTLKKLKTLESHNGRGNLVKNGKMSKKEAARMSALLGAAQGTNTWVFNGNHDVEATLTPKDVLPKQTLVFNDCHSCTYTVNVVTTKVFVQNCTDLKLIVNESIRTHMLEAFKSYNVNLEINTLIQTLQIDVCDPISIKFDKRSNMKDVVWAAAENIDVSFADSGDALATGYSTAKPHYPEVELNFERSQFYIRYVEDQLKIERVIRLTNGFTTTAREKKKFEFKQHMNAEKLATFMGVKVGPKSGKGVKRPTPYTTTNAMHMWNSL